MMARVWYTCMLTMYAGLYSTFFMKQKKSSHVAHKKNDQLAFFGLSKHEMYFAKYFLRGIKISKKKLTANFAPGPRSKKYQSYFWTSF